jgi:two-component system, NarL family, nitrate/nitrite response regulator NarL
MLPDSSALSPAPAATNARVTPPTVAVCDASEISRVGIARSLESHDLAVIAEAHDRRSALALAGSGRAAIVLVDMGLTPAPETAVEVIAAAARAGAIPIAIGVDGTTEGFLTAIRAGAAGYLTKDLPSSAWAGAIGAAARGEAPLSRAMTTILVQRFREQALLAPLAELLPSDRRLTRREWDVLECVARGNTNRGVACELSISVETVRTHVSNILTKLDAPSRSAAAARYHQLRIAHG